MKSGAVIYSKSAVEKYGRITAVQKWDDVTEPENLKSKAMTLLAQDGVMLERTITVTGGRPALYRQRYCRAESGQVYAGGQRPARPGCAVCHYRA